MLQHLKFSFVQIITMGSPKAEEALAEDVAMKDFLCP